ncbi:MAG: hypothetical protein CMM05_06710 [Rhodopirellula sp.]|nr:hypothetical protein [Rhodopirellula sp.]
MVKHPSFGVFHTAKHPRKARFFRISLEEGEDVTVVRPIPVVTRSIQTCFSRKSEPPRTRLDSKATQMNCKAINQRAVKSIFLTLAVGMCLVATTGCQVSLNGQTLPSPYYLQDDIQYFPAGPEFKLSREAAALQAARAEEKLNRK